MEELEDDFGELYADVEVQVSAAINAIPSFKQVFGEVEDKVEDSIPMEAIRSDSISMEVHAISDSSRANLENRNMHITNLNQSHVEAECEKDLILDNGSDSDDDLRIVLNEEDCRPTSRIPYGANVGNGGMVEGSDEEDEDDDLVIVTEANTSSKGRKLVDQLQMLSDGLEQSSGPGTERGNGIKGGYHTQYSQYKYIRSYGAVCSSNNKINGSGPTISFPSPSSCRRDWDMNGSNQPMRSSSGPLASSGTAAFLMTAQSGCEFSLPRNRTIFDVNIEMIDPKPWRHPGVDISDFFNFGLDEESWKQYCNCLEQFRQQGPVLTNCLRPYQVQQTECGQETVAEEVGQIQQGESVSLVIKNADRRRLELPKGRAIQVEGGIGERRPSTDLRRPRNRDSDVVIQISVQDATEFSSGSSKEELGHRNDSLLEAYENGGSGMDLDQNALSARSVDESRKLDATYMKDTGLCPLARCSKLEDASSALSIDPDNQGNKVPSDDCHHQNLNGLACEEPSDTMEMMKDTKSKANKIPLKEDIYKLEAESSLGDQIRNSSSLSYSDSDSTCKVGADTNKEKTCNPEKQTSSGSVNGLRESCTPDSYHSKGIGSNDSEREPGDCRNEFGNQSPMQEKNQCSRLRLCSVAEVKIHVDKDVATTKSNRKDCYDGNHLTQSPVKQREKQFDCEFYDRENFPFDGDSEMSIGNHSERFTTRHGKNAYNEYFCQKGPPLGIEMDPYPRRSWHERECFLEKKTSRDIKVKKKGYHYPKEDYSDRGMRAASHVESAWLGAENHVYSDEERKSWQPRKRNDKDLFEGRDDDFVIKHRYREEFVQVKYQRPVPHCGRERDHFQEKCDRLTRSHGRGIKGSDRRGRYWGSLHSDLLNDSCRSALSDDDYGGRYNHEIVPSHSCRESPLSNGRGWRDRTSFKNDAYGSRRLDQRDVGHCRQINSLKHRNSCLFGHSSRNNCNVDCLYNGRRYFDQSMAFDTEESTSKSRGRVDTEELFYPYGSSRHKSDLVKSEPRHGGVLFDDDLLKHDRKRMIREENRCSQVSDHVSSSFGMVVTNAPAALRCRDSVEQHLIGWEGKSSRRHSKAGDARCNGRNEKTNSSIDKEQRTFRHSDDSYSWKGYPSCSSIGESNSLHDIRSKVERVGEYGPEHFTVQSNETSLGKSHFNQKQDDDTSVLEEGQLAIEQEREKGSCPETKWPSEKTSEACITKEKKVNSEVASKNKTEEYDNNRILETLAKMKRRRERFKEPIALKKELDKNPKPLSDVNETAEAKQQRPTRKRRWVGS